MANPEKNVVSCMILFATCSLCLAQSCHLVDRCFKNTVAGTMGSVLEDILENPFDVGTLTTIENTYCTGDFCTRYKNCMHKTFRFCRGQLVAPYVVLELMINLVCRQESKTQNTCLGMPSIQNVMGHIFDTVRQGIDDGKCSVYEHFRQILINNNFSQYCTMSDLHYILDLFNARMRPYSEAIAGCPIMI